MIGNNDILAKKVNGIFVGNAIFNSTISVTKNKTCDYFLYMQKAKTIINKLRLNVMSFLLKPLG